MTPEALLIKRYKVTGPYPFSPYKVGDIISPTNGQINFIAAETSQYVHFQPIKMLDEMPNLFEPLPWWKDRAPEDMPEYVKVIREECIKDTGVYCKVNSWTAMDNLLPELIGQLGAELIGYKPDYLIRTELNFPGQVYGRLNAAHLLPATKEEYESYLKEKEGSK